MSVLVGGNVELKSEGYREYIAGIGIARTNRNKKAGAFAWVAGASVDKAAHCEFLALPWYYDGQWDLSAFFIYYQPLQSGLEQVLIDSATAVRKVVGRFSVGTSYTLLMAEWEKALQAIGPSIRYYLGSVGSSVTFDAFVIGNVPREIRLTLLWLF